MMKDVSSGQA
jgi:alpha-1,2-mannosyltransferase